MQSWGKSVYFSAKSDFDTVYDQECKEKINFIDLTKRVFNNSLRQRHSCFLNFFKLKDTFNIPLR